MGLYWRRSPRVKQRAVVLGRCDGDGRNGDVAVLEAERSEGRAERSRRSHGNRYAACVVPRSTPVAITVPVLLGLGLFSLSYRKTAGTV